MVTVILEREKKTIERDFEGRIKDLLQELNVNAETIVVVRNGEVVAETDRCKNSDELKFLSVISGG
jgi:sulfur carrier protein ThiS